MSRYLSSIKRYSWVVLVCVLLATIIGYGITRTLPQVYQVSSVMIVQSGAPGTTYPGGPTPSDNLTIALSYNAEILTRSTMQNVINADPKLKERKFTADDLLLDVVPTTSTTAPTITVLASAKKSADAILIANDVSTTFASMIQTQAQQQLNAQRTNLQTQLTSYQQQETSLEAKIASTPNTDPHYAVYNVQLQDVIHSEQSVQGQLLLLPPTSSLKGWVNIIQYATPHDVVASTKNTLILAATAGIGLLLGLLIMLLLIFLDNRLKTEAQVTEKLGMAYLGSFSNNKQIRAGEVNYAPEVLQEAADICASLRLTNTMAGQWHAPKGAVLLVTSNQTAEGKTTIATAIASTLAQSGNNVALVDANLRQPSTHLAFKLAANAGLSELLRGTGQESVDDVMQRTKVPNVWLLSAGSTLSNPVTLLEQRFPYILAQLRTKADVIIIDGPPLLSSAEANVLASLADGVALVVDTQVDKVPLLVRAKDMLTTLTHTPVGVVMNRVPRRKRNRYYAAAAPGLAAYDKRLVAQGSSNGVAQGTSVMLAGNDNYVPQSPSRQLSLPGVPTRPPVSPFHADNNVDRTQKPYSPSV